MPASSPNNASKDGAFPTLRNVARERMETGEPALGVGVRLSRSVEIARIMRRAGYHWLFMDLEHGAMSLETAAQISITALDNGITPMVRIPKGAFSMATRMMDNGALGIVVPSVNNPDEAREIVRQLRYPPEGLRSISSNVPQFDYVGVQVDVLVATLNRLNLIVVMIETENGLANMDAIAAVQGVDVLLIGTNDLCANLGIPGQFTHPRVEAAYVDLLAACNKHGKWAGVAGIRSPEVMRRHIDAGVRLVLAGTDLTLMAQAATQQAKSLLEPR
jgi:2-keto-3-deoxy-L-rhamnonate aldolase RhmA